MHCTKISAEFKFGGHSPRECTPPKCAVLLRRWENQHRMSSMWLIKYLPIYVWMNDRSIINNNISIRMMTCKSFDWGLTRFLQNDLDWLDVQQRIMLKLCLPVFKSLHGLAPQYLAKLCVPVADVTACPKLRSATRGLLGLARYKIENYGRRAFSYAGPHTSNSLPEHLQQTTSVDLFKRSLKTFLFRQISHSAHQRHFVEWPI